MSPAAASIIAALIAEAPTVIEEVEAWLALRKSDPAAAVAAARAAASSAVDLVEVAVDAVKK